MAQDGGSLGPALGRRSIERQFKDGIFGMAYVASKEVAVSRSAMAFAGCVEVLQMLSFPLNTSPRLPWAGFDDSIAKSVAVALNYVTTDSSDVTHGAGAYLVLLIAALAWSAAFVAIAAVVAWRFAHRTAQSPLMLRLLRGAAWLSTTILFLPFASVLLRALACPAGSATAGWMRTGAACYSGVHLFAVIAVVLVLPVFTALALFSACIFISRHFDEEGIDNKTHGRSDAVMILVKVFLSIPYNVAPDMVGGWFVTLCLVASGALWMYMYVVHRPYNNFLVNHATAGGAALYTWVCLVLALLQLQSGPRGDPSTTLLLGCVLVGALGVCLSHMSHARVAALPIGSLRRPAELHTWITAQLLKVSEAGRHDDDALRDALAFVPPSASTQGGEGCVAPAECEQTGARSGDPVPDQRTEGSSTMSASAMRKRVQDMHRRRAEAGVRRLLHLFPSDPLAQLFAGQFYREVRVSRFLEMCCLARAARCSSALDVQFFVFQRTTQLQDESEGTNVQDGTGVAKEATDGERERLLKRERGLSPIERVLFDQRFAECKTLYRVIYKHMLALWNALSSPLPDLYAVERAGTDLQRVSERAQSLYESLLVLNPESTVAMRAYGDFLLSVLNNRGLAQEYFNRADRLEEVHTRQHSSMLRHVQVGRVATGKEAEVLHNAGAVLTVNGDIGALGEIQSVSPGIYELTGFTKLQLVGQHISVLLGPSQLGRALDGWIRRFVDTGESPYISKPVLLFARSRQGAIQPVWFTMREAPPARDSIAPRFVVEVVRVRTRASHVFTTRGSDNRIVGADQDTLAELGLDAEDWLEDPNRPPNWTKSWFPATSSTYSKSFTLRVKSPAVLRLLSALRTGASGSRWGLAGADENVHLYTPQPQVREDSRSLLDASEAGVGTIDIVETPGRRRIPGDATGLNTRGGIDPHIGGAGELSHSPSVARAAQASTSPRAASMNVVLHVSALPVPTSKLGEPIVTIMNSANGPRFVAVQQQRVDVEGCGDLVLLSWWPLSIDQAVRMCLPTQMEGDPQAIISRNVGDLPSVDGEIGTVLIAQRQQRLPGRRHKVAHSTIASVVRSVVVQTGHCSHAQAIEGPRSLVPRSEEALAEGRAGAAETPAQFTRERTDSGSSSVVGHGCGSLPQEITESSGRVAGTDEDDACFSREDGSATESAEGSVSAHMEAKTSFEVQHPLSTAITSKRTSLGNRPGHKSSRVDSAADSSDDDSRAQERHFNDRASQGSSHGSSMSNAAFRRSLLERRLLQEDSKEVRFLRRAVMIVALGIVVMTVGLAVMLDQGTSELALLQQVLRSSGTRLNQLMYTFSTFRFLYLAAGDLNAYGTFDFLSAQIENSVNQLEAAHQRTSELNKLIGQSGLVLDLTPSVQYMRTTLLGQDITEWITPVEAGQRQAAMAREAVRLPKADLKEEFGHPYVYTFKINFDRVQAAFNETMHAELHDLFTHLELLKRRIMVYFALSFGCIIVLAGVAFFVAVHSLKKRAERTLRTFLSVPTSALKVLREHASYRYEATLVEDTPADEEAGGGAVEQDVTSGSPGPHNRTSAKLGRGATSQQVVSFEDDLVDWQSVLQKSTYKRDKDAFAGRVALNTSPFTRNALARLLMPLALVAGWALFVSINTQQYFQRIEDDAARLLMSQMGITMMTSTTNALMQTAVVNLPSMEERMYRIALTYDRVEQVADLNVKILYGGTVHKLHPKWGRTIELPPVTNGVDPVVYQILAADACRGLLLADPAACALVRKGILTKGLHTAMTAWCNDLRMLLDIKPAHLPLNVSIVTPTLRSVFVTLYGMERPFAQEIYEFLVRHYDGRLLSVGAEKREVETLSSVLLNLAFLLCIILLYLPTIAAFNTRLHQIRMLLAIIPEQLVDYVPTIKQAIRSVALHEDPDVDDKQSTRRKGCCAGGGACSM